MKLSKIIAIMLMILMLTGLTAAADKKCEKKKQALEKVCVKLEGLKELEALKSLESLKCLEELKCLENLKDLEELSELEDALKDLKKEDFEELKDLGKKIKKKLKKELKKELKRLEKERD